MAGLKDERLVPALKNIASPLKTYTEEDKHQDRLAPVIVAQYWISPSKKERYGKIYATALCCLMQEVYVAWRPTFSHIPEEQDPIPHKDDIEIEIL